MPTYEYECTECGVIFDLFQPITEKPRRRLRKDDPKPCDCDAPIHRRISSGSGIIFKGSGFYQTDYRSADYQKAAKAEKEADTGKSKPDKNGDTKKSKKAEKKNKTTDS